MKRTINGKSYNTETSTKIYEREQNITDLGGLDGILETLYQTKSGDYFIHGDGGARTWYGHKTATGGLVGGERILPISAELANKFIEHGFDGGDYAQMFQK